MGKGILDLSRIDQNSRWASGHVMHSHVITWQDMIECDWTKAIEMNERITNAD